MDKLEPEERPIHESSIKRTGQGNLKARKIVYYILGVLGQSAKNPPLFQWGDELAI